MNAASRRVLAALADRVIGPGERVQLRPADVDVVGGVERMLGNGPALVHWGIGLLLIAFNLAPPLFGFGVRPFTSMSGGNQDAYLASALGSRWYERRMSTRSLIILIQTAFYGDARVSAAIRGDGPADPGGAA